MTLDVASMCHYCSSLLYWYCVQYEYTIGTYF